MIEQSQSFGCVIVRPQQLPFELSSNDPNTGNLCFVSYFTLEKLGISKCGYRILKGKRASQLSFIFGSERVQDNVLALTPVLADTLQLKFKHMEVVSVERIQLNMSDIRYGMPDFLEALKIELAPVANAAQESLYEPTVLKKLKFDTFYCRVGQELRVEVDKLSEELYSEQKVAIKRNYLRCKQQAKRQQNNSHATLRLVVTGISYPHEDDKSNVVHQTLGNGIVEPRYVLYQPTKTNLHFEHRTLHKWNSLKHPKLQTSILSIFSRSPAYKSIEELLKNKLKDNPVDHNASVVFVHTKPDFMLDEYFQYLAEKQLLNYLRIDCSLEHSLQPIGQFVNDLYRKTPCLGHLKNIDWLHELLSGNLESKRNSQRTVEGWLNQFRNDLLKRSDSMPALMLLTYHHDNFEIAGIEGVHHKFEPSPTDIQHMQQLLIEGCALFETAEQRERIKELVAPMPWGQLHHILQKGLSFDDTVKEIEKTLKKIVVAKIPEVKWSDIGGLDVAKEQIIETILLPKNHPYIFDDLIRPRTGLLFYGPPGTGKTLLAKCIANECKMNFISVKGPEMLNMYIGQSEKNVRETFERAMENRPCIIFFDELDALIPKRGSGSDSSQVMDRIVAELLTQMDLAAKKGGIFVIGATNRPDLLDPSIMRPGRFDKQIYLGICTQAQDRIKILQAQTNKLGLSEDVNFREVVEQLPPNFTGADFYGLTSKAVTNALNRRIQLIESKLLDSTEHSKLMVTQQDFLEASKLVKPSVTPEQLRKFEQLRAKYS